MLLLCFRSPVREVFLKYEVLVFQPCTVTPPHLGYLCLTLHFNIALLPLPFLFSFPDLLSSPLSYLLPILSCSLSNISRFIRSPPPLPVQSASHLDVARTRHPPDSAACPCAPHHMNASAAVYCAGTLPTFTALGLHPGPYHPLGGSPVAGPSAPLFPFLASPKLLYKYWYRLVLDIVVGWVFVKRLKVRASLLPGIHVSWSSIPPLLVHSGANQEYPPPPLLFPSLVVVIPPPSVEEVWGISI